MSRTHLSQTPLSLSATSVRNWWSRSKSSLYPRLACFLFFRTAFWCHLVTSQDISFSEFLSMFAFANQIFRPADSKMVIDANAVMMSWSPVLEPLDASHRQSASLIQMRLLLALFFAVGISGSRLSAGLLILLTSGSIQIKTFQAERKLASN